MTSREALEYLMKNAITVFRDEDCLSNCFKCYKEIKKDLELLEILKHLIQGIERTFNLPEVNESGVTGTIIKDFFINNDITGMVEEWLENDNR